MPRDSISTSCAAVWVSRYRATASESFEWMSTVSPRSSRESAPGTASSCWAVTPGTVARTVRPAAMALIWAAVPSATMRPWRTRMMRSAYSSASSR